VEDTRLSYPRNNATPEPVAIGAVIQISDGAVQTSGVTVRIKPIGVAEADGAGTTAYSTDGIVLYTPTQGETNYTSFILIAKKSACIPVAMTVVTSASAVPGVATLAAIVHTGATIPNAPTSGDLTTTMKASVNAEVLDVLNVDTFAELAAVPSATSSLKDKITWLFMWARNRATQTASERKLYADDATTVVSTETVSDDGTTYAKGEAS